MNDKGETIYTLADTHGAFLHGHLSNYGTATCTTSTNAQAEVGELHQRATEDVRFAALSDSDKLKSLCCFGDTPCSAL